MNIANNFKMSITRIVFQETLEILENLGGGVAAPRKLLEHVLQQILMEGIVRDRTQEDVFNGAATKAIEFIFFRLILSIGRGQRHGS